MFHHKTCKIIFDDFGKHNNLVSHQAYHNATTKNRNHARERVSNLMERPRSLLQHLDSRMFQNKKPNFFKTTETSNTRKTSTTTSYNSAGPHIKNRSNTGYDVISEHAKRINLRSKACNTRTDLKSESDKCLITRSTRTQNIPTTVSDSAGFDVNLACRFLELSQKVYLGPWNSSKPYPNRRARDVSDVCSFREMPAGFRYAFGDFYFDNTCTRAENLAENNTIRHTNNDTDDVFHLEQRNDDLSTSKTQTGNAPTIDSSSPFRVDSFASVDRFDASARGSSAKGYKDPPKHPFLKFRTLPSRFNFEFKCQNAAGGTTTWRNGFFRNANADSHGMVLLDEEYEFAVVVIRGTSTAKNAMQDLKFTTANDPSLPRSQIKKDLLKRCQISGVVSAAALKKSKVHSGVCEHFESYKESL